MKAFPVQESVPQDDDYEGMDLRDYFAAKAMNAVIKGSFEDVIEACKDDNSDVEGFIAHYSYKMADAMMEARK